MKSMNRNLRSRILDSGSPWSVFHFVKDLRLFSLIALLLCLTACGDKPPTRPASSILSINGAMTAGAMNAVDSDTNNLQDAFATNSTAAEAQILPNPVTLGGYLTAVATGVSGDRFAASSDLEDWYQVSLTAGQVMTLTIADHDGVETNPANPDFDLYLYDSSDTAISSFVQSSVETRKLELISVLASGDYMIRVLALSGSSSYTLSLSPAPQAAQAAALRIEDEFIPNEIILRFKKTSVTSGTQAMSAKVASAGLVHLAGQAGEPMLYRMIDPSSSARVQNAQPQSLSGRALQKAKRATIDQVKSLRTRSDVLSADLNYIRQPLLTPNDSLYVADQWNLPLINMPLAWDQSTGSTNVVIAVLDTGVLSAHPDLVGRLCTSADDCAGYDFVSDTASAADGGGIDPVPEDPGNGQSSNKFHGTHVSGILGALSHNAAGIAGVDWNARIMPVRVLGSDGAGTSYDIVQGLRYATGLSNDSGMSPVVIADILNLSFGGTGYSQVEQDLFNQLYAAGTFSIAAAGNGRVAFGDLPFYPAAYAGVVSVSAVDKTKNLATYSSFGLTIDVAAPGGEPGTSLNGIMSTSGSDPSTPTYESDAGTSMAAPHVAGVAALMLAVDPLLTPAEFDALLAGGLLTEDLNLDGAARRNDLFGYGLIDAQKALVAAQDLAAGAALPPTLSISSGLLDFGSTTDTLPLVLGNSGGGGLTVTDLLPSAAWITLDASAVPTGGLGTYSVLVNRIGLSPGTYAETLRITTTEADIYTLDLLIQVGASQAASVGRQTISLHDAVSDTLLRSLSVDSASGVYSFSFPTLDPGTYLVKTSSDLDHDGQSCDSGEACVTSAVIRLTNQNATINLSSGFGQ